ncbi:MULTISPECIES: glutamine-hydrolyzing carbamoyl-phosphate synthase small subunit [unclassified Marinobacter]|uniref:glutamine-hydrolyzing carbamoyl-phosphate synthase small subunit n=1 Tax=unclassified Marinobacter TaxID=83889 RepID=UPI0026E25A03|nr:MULTISPECIES: glutamine-hydrolyzing carbamoyl-phosphate synthase small subunit [unclassified Marinobacter]MDO6443221.1 glutamine-hydrolyzing carbamoyl-phosphate synthase small subunit [Marinobacter sp. 2_MG-2023]MDO6822559.1 glutamine-hydrolyzing carbamoyl-phosphate synthase small subunit [Marinobacter sp. 1_MG-2023]
MSTPAILALADGSLFYGTAIGADGETSGEVVFNTAMTGYQEILTDPSYSRQLVTLTYPHIGNTGVNEEDVESDRIQAAGLIIRDLPLVASNWRSNGSLDEYLRNSNIVGIADIDTRRLTRILRDKGSQNGAIVAGADATAERALELANAFPGLKGMDLAKEVTCDTAYKWTQGEWTLGQGYAEAGEPKFKVVAWDYGVKFNILRMLVSRGCDVTVVPAQTPASEVLAMNPDGIFLSNGPGDPEPCDYAIKAIQEVLETEIPVFGICLGHQLLALASGAKSMKMSHGHHGANHPVQRIDKGTVMITSQNHGFAVDETSLPASLEVTHKSLFDGTLQGIRRTDKPAFSFQGHPEASPGPGDVAPLFDEFIRLMEVRKG